MSDLEFGNDVGNLWKLDSIQIIVTDIESHWTQKDTSFIRSDEMPSPKGKLICMIPFIY